MLTIHPQENLYPNPSSPRIQLLIFPISYNVILQLSNLWSPNPKSKRDSSYGFGRKRPLTHRISLTAIAKTWIPRQTRSMWTESWTFTKVILFLWPRRSRWGIFFDLVFAWSFLTVPDKRWTISLAVLMDYPRRRLTPYPNRKQRTHKVVNWLSFLGKRLNGKF